MPAKKIPVFKNEDEERKYWATHDSTDHIDWSKARKVALPNLKPNSSKVDLAADTENKT